MPFLYSHAAGPPQRTRELTAFAQRFFCLGGAVYLRAVNCYFDGLAPPPLLRNLLGPLA